MKQLRRGYAMNFLPSYCITDSHLRVAVAHLLLISGHPVFDLWKK